MATQAQAPPGGGGFASIASGWKARVEGLRADILAEIDAIFGDGAGGPRDAPQSPPSPATTEPPARDEAVNTGAAAAPPAGDEPEDDAMPPPVQDGDDAAGSDAEQGAGEEPAGVPAEALAGGGDGREAGPVAPPVGGGWSESFDDGTGALDHLWSGSVDTSVPGQITLGGHSGVMQFPGGADRGFGFGDYTVTAKVEGDQVGPAALLWPADDVWPGTELNFVEVLSDGTAYGTAHQDRGYDWYEATMYEGVDEGEVHEYGISWRPDGVTYLVDGVVMGTVEIETEDFANGGVNSVFGVMNQNPGTSITVYDMSYTPVPADALV